MTEKIEIDLEEGRVRAVSGSEAHDYAIDSPEAFQAISQAWLRSGWQTKHVYTFTWMGRPVIQLPEDLLHTGSHLSAATGCHRGDRNCSWGVADLLCKPLQGAG
jgi:hypothetical protein